MSTTSLKQKMIDSIRELPDDAGIDDAMERLFLLYKIEKGVQQADAGQTLSHEDAMKRLGKWLD